MSHAVLTSWVIMKKTLILKINNKKVVSKSDIKGGADANKKRKRLIKGFLKCFFIILGVSANI